MENATDEKKEMSENKIINENKLILFRGQIIYKRQFGKKLAFINILSDDRVEIQAMLRESEYVNTTKIGQEILSEGYYKKDPLGNLFYTPHKIEVLSESQENSKFINKNRRIYEKTTKRKTDERALCKSYKKNNSCDILQCTFRHYLNPGEEERLKILKLRQERDFKLVHEDDPYNNNSNSKMKKSLRHKYFAEFLVNKFGLDNLRNGHILDIAGGKG